MECVNWKARLVVQLARSVEPAPMATAKPAPAAKVTRDCFFGGTRPVSTPIYKSTELTAGTRVVGPSVIEEPTTTLVVFPGMSARVSGGGNYLLRIS